MRYPQDFNTYTAHNIQHTQHKLTDFDGDPVGTSVGFKGDWLGLDVGYKLDDA